jgi:hypothetical protein
VRLHDHRHNYDCNKITTRRRPTALHGHASSPPPPHGHTTHTHGCDHHGYSHGHSHGHGRDHAYDCNRDRDNGNASLAMPALARPRPPMGTLVAARHAGALTPSVGPSCHGDDAGACPRSGPLAPGIRGLHPTSASALGCDASGFAVVAPSAIPVSSRPGQWLPQWGKARHLWLAVLSRLRLRSRQRQRNHTTNATTMTRLGSSQQHQRRPRHQLEQ